VRLGANLRDYLDGRGTAYRMGGDEFCALFEPGDQVFEPIVAGAAAALSERGEGFAIGCSHGSILLPVEALEASEALRVADQRMYAQKNGGRASASRQSKEVLVRALAERNLPPARCRDARRARRPASGAARRADRDDPAPRSCSGRASSPSPTHSTR